MWPCYSPQLPHPNPETDSTWCRGVFLVPFKCVLTLPLARCARTEMHVSCTPFQRTTQAMQAWIPVCAQWESSRVEAFRKQISTPASHGQKRAGSDCAPEGCRTSMKMAQEHLTGAPKTNWFQAVLAHQVGKESEGNWVCVCEHKWTQMMSNFQAIIMWIWLLSVQFPDKNLCSTGYLLYQSYKVSALPVLCVIDWPTASSGIPGAPSQNTPVVS